jgi:hypothetical protein
MGLATPRDHPPADYATADSSLRSSSVRKRIARTPRPAPRRRVAARRGPSGRLVACPGRLPEWRTDLHLARRAGRPSSFVAGRCAFRGLTGRIRRASEPQPFQWRGTPRRLGGVLGRAALAPSGGDPGRVAPHDCPGRSPADDAIRRDARHRRHLIERNAIARRRGRMNARFVIAALPESSRSDTHKELMQRLRLVAGISMTV